MTRRQPDIIAHPHLQTPAQRTLSSLLTLAAWTIWIYLFLPIISIAAWYLGIAWFNRFLLDPHNQNYFWSLAIYGAVILGAGAVILTWSSYNHWRFTGRDRRKPASPVSDAMICKRFGIRPQDLEKVHAARIMTLHLDANGYVEQVVVKVSDQPEIPTDAHARPRQPTVPPRTPGSAS